MDQSMQIFSENLLHMMKGALMMLFILMCINLYPKRKENEILGSLFWLLLTMLILLLASFGSMFGELKDSEYYINFNVLTSLCLIPLIGSFLLKVVLPDWTNIQRALLLLSPTVLFVIIHAITHSDFLLTLSFIYTAIIAVGVFALITFISIRYDRYLKDNFSNIDNMSVRWVRVIIYVFVAWYLAWGLIINQDNRWLDSAYYLFLIVIWIFIYQYSIKHVSILETQELFEAPQVPEAAPRLSEPVNDTFRVKLEIHMEQERPWMNPCLTLQELASSLNSNRTYLSEYFNKTLGTTFYDYLNNFRVQHACKLLQDEPNLSISHIGEKSGFNSLSTFRRAFEKQTGMTPARYRRKQEEEYYGCFYEHEEGVLSIK